MNPPADAAYRFCAQVLAGAAPGPAIDVGPEIADTAVREGVAGLVHAGLQDTDGVLAPAERDALAALAREGAMRHMHALAEARRIQAALDAAGIRALWLKGIALGQWLYASPHLRDVADLDLLLEDRAASLRAADVLAPLGYVLPNPHIAGDLIVHELLACSERSGLELDLHWDVSNAPLFADRLAWDALWAASMPLPSLGPGARGLGPVHAFLHACVHRATNALNRQAFRLRWLYDIHALALRFDARDWDAVAAHAREARMADACLDALRACGDVFGTPMPPAVIEGLQRLASAEPVRTARLSAWLYWQRMTWRRLPTLATRLRWLRQLLLPDMAHLRARYGSDGAGVLRILGRRIGDGMLRLRHYHRSLR